MKRCFASLFVLSFVLVIPAFARVVSYAPYTDRVAVPAFQARTARYFVLIEAKSDEMSERRPNELVLYDSTGAEEPRVIAPKGSFLYEQAALYERGDGSPVVLAIGYNFLSNAPVAPPVMRVSEGGGAWRDVEGVGAFHPLQVLDTDTGGPYTHGLFAPIVIGNDSWPFIVSLGGNGVWAVGGNGTARAIYRATDARVIGRNAAGDRFLVHSANAVWITSADGPATKLASVDPTGAFAGWITSSGAAYVEMLRNEGRFLYTVSGGQLTFVAGPTDTAPPVLGAPPIAFPTMRFFAVPTADYEGAWTIHRETGKPTRLSRHTISNGLQTMWTDVSGPQVEALIAGRTGQALLVQVHRERDGIELSRPFIDPALAVWRVGQSAPRDYDELYLNESWNKGFVHVDVEEIESGKPFVFNSGFTQAAPPSRVSPPISGGGDVIQEWGVVRGSLKQRLVIPGVARLRGAFDSFWVTDVTVYNPLDTPQQVEVQFVPLGTQLTASARTVTLALEPFEIRAVPDALQALFGMADGGGTLHFLPATGISATARTYSRKGNGTFGFGMQAIDFFNAAGPRFALSFAGAFPGQHFRTNLLLTDTSGRGTHAKLQAFGVTGFTGTSDAALATPPGGTVQLNGAGPGFGLGSTDGAGLVVQPTSGTAIAAVVAIDNRTNDPTYFPPDLPAAIVRAIPVIGHLDGANGAKFRSDIYLYNPDERTRTVALGAKKWDSEDRRVVSFTLLPHESRVIPDALKTLFGMEGLARLRYATNPDWPGGEGVRVTSRTYTAEPSGATYGCLVPPLNNFQIGTSGDRLEILGISGGPGFRSNIGLVHLDDFAQRNPTVRLTIIDHQRKVVDSFSVQVPARGGMQINDIFGSRGLTPPPAALLIIEILEGDQIGAYATLTDNVTNDSTYLGAQLGAQPQGH